MKILYVTRTQFNSLNAGNSQYTASLIKELTKNGYVVDIFYLRKVDQDSTEIFKSITNESARIVNYDYQWGRPQPLVKVNGIYKVDNEISYDLLSTFESYVKQEAYDLVIADYIYLSLLAEVTPQRTSFAVNTHDIHADRHLLVRNNGDVSNTPIYSVSTEDEAMALQRVDAFIAITKVEFDYFSSLNPSAIGILFPFIEQGPLQVGSERYTSSTASINNQITIGFIGSDNYVNISGIKSFLEEIEMLSAGLGCKIDLVICGNVCNSIEDKVINQVSVKKLGFINNPKEFYDQIDVVVLPIGPSTGQKIKTIEALSYKKGVIGTKEAFTGFPLNGTTNRFVYHSINDVAAAFLEPGNKIDSQIWINEIKQCSGNIYTEYLRYVKQSINDLPNKLKLIKENCGYFPNRNPAYAANYSRACDDMAVLIKTLKQKQIELKKNWDKYKKQEKENQILIDMNEVLQGQSNKKQIKHQEENQISFRYKNDVVNLSKDEPNPNDRYKSTHIIIAVDWNGGNLFLQWVLTLCYYIRSKDRKSLCIIQLGPNSTIEDYRQILVPDFIRINSYSENYFADIIDNFPQTAFASQEVNMYLHGWDAFSCSLIENYGIILPDIVDNLCIYSDASKPQTSVRVLDQYHWNSNCKFNQLKFVNFTQIPETNSNEYLIEKAYDLTSDDLDSLYKARSTVEISGDFHENACKQSFELDNLKQKAKLPTVIPNSALIVLRYWGMYTYKFGNDENAAKALYEQIIGSLRGEEVLYIKKESRLSDSIQSMVISMLKIDFKVIIFDELLEEYAGLLKGYKLSFGIEPLLYIFPELYDKFSRIISFDGSYCWFVSQLAASSDFKLNATLVIGANLNLPMIKLAPESTREYITHNARDQILPFKKQQSFEIKETSTVATNAMLNKATQFEVTQRK